MRTIFLVTFSCLFTCATIAQNFPFQFPRNSARALTNLNVITTAVPLVAMTSNASVSGLGNVNVVGLDRNPEAAISGNPALLVNGRPYIQAYSSISPWLRRIVPGMYLNDNAVCFGLGKRHAVGISHKYFRYGDVQFTDQFGNLVNIISPSEHVLQLNYAIQLTPRLSLGSSLKYIYSNLTGGNNVQGSQTYPGTTMATDLGIHYASKQVSINASDFSYSAGASINNVGGKIQYSDVSSDFIPATLKMGGLINLEIVRENHAFGFTSMLQFQKLLVPTPPVYQIDSSGNFAFDENGDLIIASGRDPNTDVLRGAFQSFVDAPGKVTWNGALEPSVESGSRFREEVNEIVFQFGQEEYIRLKQDKIKLSLKQGVFIESDQKGARKFVTLGTGINIYGFRLDYARYVAVGFNNLLGGTNFVSIGYQYYFRPKE